LHDYIELCACCDDNFSNISCGLLFDSTFLHSPITYYSFAGKLFLSYNSLDGTIPTELGSLSNLGELLQTRTRRTFVA
jgi:hypothetical protein